MNYKSLKKLSDLSRQRLWSDYNYLKQYIKEDIYSYFKWWILNDRYPLLALRNHKKIYNFLYKNINKLYEKLLYWSVYNLYSNYKKSNNVRSKDFYIFITFEEELWIVRPILHFAFWIDSLNKEFNINDISKKNSILYNHFIDIIEKLDIKESVYIYNYLYDNSEWIQTQWVLLDICFDEGNKKSISSILNKK